MSTEKLNPPGRTGIFMKPVRPLRHDRVAIARHNGIGDMVMTFPFVSCYLKKGYEVTFYVDSLNHEWIRWIYPSLILRQSVPNYMQPARLLSGHDYYLNFNLMGLADEAAVNSHYPPTSWQILASTLAQAQGLPVPVEMSPSRHNPRVVTRGTEMLIFTKSVAASRTLAPEIVQALRKKFPQAQVDPQYPSLLKFVQAVSTAGRVIGSDSGPIHLAELFGVPWTCLSTTMAQHNRYQFYKHGKVIQANIACSPCYLHFGCGDPQCVSKFDIDAI